MITAPLPQADLVGEGAGVDAGDRDAALDAELGASAGGIGLHGDAELGLAGVDSWGGGFVVGVAPATSAYILARSPMVTVAVFCLPSRR